MEDPKNSQASSSDTLSLGRNRGPIWDPNFQPQHLPNFRGYPCSACARQKTSIRSIDPHLSFPLPLPFMGCGKVGQKLGPIAKLGRSGLEIGAFNSSCKSMKLVSFGPACPAQAKPVNSIIKPTIGCDGNDP